MKEPPFFFSYTNKQKSRRNGYETLRSTVAREELKEIQVFQAPRRTRARIPRSMQTHSGGQAALSRGEWVGEGDMAGKKSGHGSRPDETHV